MGVKVYNHATGRVKVHCLLLSRVIDVIIVKFCINVYLSCKSITVNCILKAIAGQQLLSCCKFVKKLQFMIFISQL